MSISREDRLSNLEYALKLFARDVGDEYFQVVHLTPEGGEYEKIYPTTWTELTQSYYLTVIHGKLYRLTKHGWLRGIELSGQLETKEFKKRLLGALSRALAARA